MRTPIVYTPKEIKEWSVSRSTPTGEYVACRPMGHTVWSFWHRVRTAWRVFTGRYDALRWPCQESTKSYT